MDQRKTKVLVVEDEAIVAVDLEDRINASGYEVCGLAASGEEAIELVAIHHPDIILMDIRLQGKMGGIKAAQIIRDQFQVPVVFLTAHSDDATLELAKVAQPFGYLLKPFGTREFRVAIEMAMYKVEAERKLAASEKWNRSIIDSMATAFIALDEDERILDWNPLAEKLFGWKKEEVLNKNFIQLLIPDRLQSLYVQAFQKFRLNNLNQILINNVEHYGVKRDGSELPIEITILANSKSESPRLFGFINDISSRRQIAVQKAQVEELEKANRELERFAHLASHDLQEPLRTITLYAELLENALRAEITDEEGEMLGAVVNSAKRMSQLVSELLNFSRIGTDQHTRMEKINTSTVLKHTLENLNHLLTTHQVQIKAGELPEVVGNAFLLQQVFQNLITNAIKYHSGESIEIAIEAVRIGEFWRFTVQDNGIGFDEAYADQIFEMFRRLHSSKEYAGTGAGLPICRKIVNLHGGRIWAESKEGVGSKFHFTIPSLDSTGRSGVLKGMRILIVDDNPEIKSLVLHLLNGTGANVQFTDNGFKALDIIKASTFDLVLMDIVMPGLSGIEVAMRMKQDGIQTPIIAYTGNELNKSDSQFPSEVFADVISKSMPSKLMIDHLQMWYASVKGS